MEEIVIKDSLKITPIQIGGSSKTVQLVLNGYLDTYNSPEFQSHINSMINSEIKYLVFNCNGLNYISSTGIGAFTAFLKLLKQKKGDMVLFGLQDKVLEVFQLLGFTSFFKIASDLDEALSSLKKQGRGREHDTREGGTSAAFPLIFECPRCRKKLKTSRPGKFRCSGCKGIVVVDDKGNAAQG
ncbi:MAG: anti-sigma factor antagonist [Spirochaetota bacterium]